MKHLIKQACRLIISQRDAFSHLLVFLYFIVIISICFCYCTVFRMFAYTTFSYLMTISVKAILKRYS